MEPYYKAPLPNYETAPLRFDDIMVAAVQMRSKKVDHQDPAPVIKENVDHICWLIDVAERAQQVHLLVFPEFALQGSAIGLWNREDFLRLAIELPGPETEQIGKKAREYDCYIVMAGMTKEPDEWPGHFFNTSFIIGPDGNVIHKHWKAHADPGGLEYATTCHDVLDEFVKRYGWDAVWPVAKTDIGNIATFICSEGFVPETGRVFGLKGAEILCRCIAGGNRHYASGLAGDPGLTMQAYCMGSGIYGIFCDSAIIVNPEPYSTEDIGCGQSRIFNPTGRQIAEARSTHEQIIPAPIPIAAYRKTHSLPPLRQEIYAPMYNQFVGKYPPNLYSEYLPKDAIDAANYARRKARY